jgi:mono/diheme cytochrome c family protein
MSEPRKPDWGADAQRLAGRYAVVIGTIVTFALFALIVTPALLRERRAPPAPPSDQPAAASVGWLDQAEAPPSKGKDLPPIDPATVMTPNPKLLARGEALFKQHCTSCHGDGGRGDGPAIATLNPKPRNLTSPEKWAHGYRITDIFATITHGSKGTAMAAYDFIPPADRMALVHYVRSLGAFDHGADDPKALATLADSFRSKGVHIPNRIPASLAIRKMVAEQAPVAPLKLPAASDASAAARLMRRVVVDPARAGRTVAATSRSDLASVARAWTAGVPGNGFATELVALDAEEWHTLASTLLGTDLPAAAPIDGGVP